MTMVLIGKFVDEVIERLRQSLCDSPCGSGDIQWVWDASGGTIWEPWAYHLGIGFGIFNILVKWAGPTATGLEMEHKMQPNHVYMS